MRMTRQHHRKLIAEISITPLLDLVFILLFAFMVALPLVSQSDVLLAAKQPAAPAASEPPAQVLTLRAEAAGSVTLEGEALTLTAAEEQLRTRWLSASPEFGVRVEIAPTQPVSTLADVMAMLGRAGVRRTAFEVGSSPP